mgnify:FL=1
MISKRSKSHGKDANRTECYSTVRQPSCINGDMRRGTNRPLKLLAFNADGIISQKYELCELIQSEKSDIILLNETHLKPHHRFNVPNFTTYRIDRLTQDGGGGTAILVKSGIPHQHFDLPPLISIEATAIQLQIGGKYTLIVSVYKQPRTALAVQDITELTTLADKVILAGDLNAKHANWNSYKNNQAGNILNTYITRHNNLDINAPTEPTCRHKANNN